MSWENLKDAYRTRLGNLTAKSVLVLIVDEANAEGLAFVGLDRVATLTEINKRTTLRILQVFGAIDLVGKTEAVFHPKGRAPELRPAFQVNLARLGLNLVDEFSRAYKAASGKPPQRLGPVAGDPGGKCLRDAEASVSETRRGVSETRGGVSETQPPDPHIGVSPLLPFGSPTPVAPLQGARGLDLACDQVCSALGISEERRRKRREVRSAIARAAEKGELPATIALGMIAAVRKQALLHDRGLVKFQFGLEKFLGDGIWREENRWGWDNEAVKLAREAGVGRNWG